MTLLNDKAINGMTRAEHRALLREILNINGRDSIALDLVSEITGLDRELFTDGELLDLIGDLIDIWRGIQL